MVLSREEKEKMVLDLYYNKGYTYKQLTRELRMSPNQIREIIKRHEEKNDAIVNKKKELSMSSKAYKLFYEGKTGRSSNKAGFTSEPGNSVSFGILETAESKQT
jgi:uncharacterized protein YjcR